MYLIVQIPAFSEMNTIIPLVEETHKILAKQDSLQRFEIIILDDGSTDKTPQYAEELQQRYEEVSLIRHERRSGLGKVFQRGVYYAKSRQADILVNMDGDGQFFPKDIPKLITPIIQQKADVVLASRFKNPALEPRMSPIKLWGNKVISRLLSFLTKRRFYDVSCGFRAFSQNALDYLNPQATFTYTHQSILQCVSAGQRIQEVPLKIRGEREFGRSKIARNLPKYILYSLAIITRTLLCSDWRQNQRKGS